MNNDSYASVAPSRPIAAQQGLPTTVASLFYAPSRTFSTLRDKRWWLVPFLLCLATAVLYQVSTAHYRMQDLKQEITSDPQYSATEVSRRIDNIDRQATGGFSFRQLSFATTVLAAGQAAKLFGLALVIWLALQFQAVSVSYMTIVSACSFIFLIKIPEAVLSGFLIDLKGTARVFLGPAVLLPPDWFQSSLFTLLNRLDVFSIWMAILLVMALPIVADIAHKRAALIVAALWVVWLLEGALFGGLVRIS